MPLASDWLIIGVGVLVIFGLIYLNWHLYLKLRQAKQQQQISADKKCVIRNQAIDSIRILARSIISNQVDFAEACIRIKVLIDSAAPELHSHSEFSIFNQIYEATAHMPTQNARKQINKRFLHKLDMQRFKVEQDNEQKIVKGAEALLNSPTLNNN